MKVWLKENRLILMYLLGLIFFTFAFMFAISYNIMYPIQTFLSVEQEMYKIFILLGSVFMVFCCIVYAFVFLIKLFLNTTFTNIKILQKYNESDIVIISLFIGVSIILLLNLFLINPVSDRLNLKAYDKYLSIDILPSYYTERSLVRYEKPFEILEEYDINKEDIQNMKWIVNDLNLNFWIFTQEDTDYFKEHHTLSDFKDKQDYYINNNLVCNVNHFKMEPDYCIECGVSKRVIYSILLNDWYLCKNCNNILSLDGDYCKLCGIENKLEDRLKLALIV